VKPHAPHGFTGDPSKRFPCLVDLREITAVDQAWATDITYIQLQKGFLYLVAIMDLHSRHMLCWKLSNSLDTEFCLEALEMALSGGRMPQIFHYDQGCQFTSTDFVTRLQAEEIKISWSGRKRCYDNILVERLWRTLKYEEVYLRAYRDGWESPIGAGHSCCLLGAADASTPRLGPGASAMVSA
jgi:putative transposase